MGIIIHHGIFWGSTMALIMRLLRSIHSVILLKSFLHEYLISAPIVQESSFRHLMSKLRSIFCLFAARKFLTIYNFLLNSFHCNLFSLLMMFLMVFHPYRKKIFQMKISILRIFQFRDHHNNESGSHFYLNIFALFRTMFYILKNLSCRVFLKFLPFFFLQSTRMKLFFFLLNDGLQQGKYSHSHKDICNEGALC